MSKRNRTRTADVDDTKVVEVITETVVEPTEPVAEATSEEQAAEPVAEQPAVDAAPVVEVAASVYGLIATAEELAKRNIRKGFETALITELGKGPGTCQELTDRLLASGEYFRVAPRAAELRPTKPTQFLLTKWVGGGICAIASAEEAAAHYEAAAAAASEELETAEVSDELSGEGSTTASEATEPVAV